MEQGDRDVGLGIDIGIGIGKGAGKVAIMRIGLDDIT